MKSRKITNSGTLKNIGKFPSIKNEKLVWFESHLERDFIYLIEFDKSIIRYREQPFKVEYLLDGKKRNYFPDFLVEREGRKQVIEIKPQSKTEKDEFVHFSRVMKNRLTELGYEYLVITDSTIRLQPKLSNIQLLWRYARYPVNTKHKILLYELFSNSASFSLAQVCVFLTQAKESIELIYALLFHGYLLTNIEKPITSNSIVTMGNFD